MYELSSKSIMYNPSSSSCVYLASFRSCVYKPSSKFCMYKPSCGSCLYKPSSKSLMYECLHLMYECQSGIGQNPFAIYLKVLKFTKFSLYAVCFYFLFSAFFYLFVLLRKTVLIQGHWTSRLLYLSYINKHSYVHRGIQLTF